MSELLCQRTPYHQFLVIPKNATTSIVTLLHGLEGETVERAHDIARRRQVPFDPFGPPAVTVFRDPWERFVSTWRNKVYRPHRPDTGLIRVEGARAGMGLTEFAEWVLEREIWRFRDRHIGPQHLALPKNDVSITFLRHDHLAADWRYFRMEELYGSLPIRNTSQHVEGDDVCDLEGEIRRAYALDQVLWDNTVKAGLTRDGDEV